jgi:large conductance mechanosensitive channel
VSGFIDFVRKGNLVQVAVAFVMGVAFAAVVTSFVDNLVSPLLGLFGGADFSDEAICLSDVCSRTVDPETGAVTTTGVLLGWGAFVTAVITFLVTAAVLYFLVVKPYLAVETRLKKEEEKESGPSEVELLTQIRDSLQSGGTPHAGADLSNPKGP